MLSIGRSPLSESNSIEAQQPGWCSNPQISVRGLCNRIGRAVKDSILKPPCRVCVLGDVEGRIDCPDRTHCEEKQHEAEKRPQCNVRPFCFCSRVCTVLSEWAHGQS